MMSKIPNWTHEWAQVDESAKYPITTVFWSTRHKFRINKDFDWRSLIFNTGDLSISAQDKANQLIDRYLKTFVPGTIYSTDPKLLQSLIHQNPEYKLVGVGGKNIASECESFLVLDKPVLVVQLETVEYFSKIKPRPKKMLYRLGWIEFNIPIITATGRVETIRVSTLDITNLAVSHWLSSFLVFWHIKKTYVNHVKL